MLIERVWAANDYRNFHYLVACPDSGEALAIDPLEWSLCLEAARRRQAQAPLQRIDGERLAGLRAGDQEVKIPEIIGRPDTFDDHEATH